MDDIPEIQLEPASVRTESLTPIHDPTRENTFLSIPRVHTSFIVEQTDSQTNSPASSLQSVTNVRKESFRIDTPGSSIKMDNQRKVVMTGRILAPGQALLSRNAIKHYSAMTAEERQRNQKWAFLFGFGFIGVAIITVILTYVNKYHSIF